MSDGGRRVTFPRRVVGKVRSEVRRRRPGPDPVPADEPSVAPVPPPVATGDGPVVTLINDTRDQISFGSVSLSEGLIGIVQAVNPTATILPIPSHWLVEIAASSPFVGGAAGRRQPPAPWPTVCDQFEAVADEWLAQPAGGNEFLDRLRAADAVVLNGEGSLYRRNQSAVRELFMAWLSKERLGLPTAYLNGGLHLTRVLPILPAMTRKTFGVLDAVALREPRSLANLAEFAPGVAGRIVPDAAFWFTPADVRGGPTVDAVRRKVGSGDYFVLDPGSMPVDARPGGGSALTGLIRALRAVVPNAVVVPMSPGDRYIEDAAREAGADYFPDVEDFREFMGLTSGARFLVSGRHHNTILAAITGCPTLTLGAVTDKVHGACEMFDGLLGETYDGTDLRPRIPDLVEHARGYVAAGEPLRDALLAVSRRRHEEAMEHGRIVAGLLAHRSAPETRR